MWLSASQPMPPVAEGQPSGTAPASSALTASGLSWQQNTPKNQAQEKHTKRTIDVLGVAGKVNGLHATDLLLLSGSDSAGSGDGGAEGAAGDRVGGALLDGSGQLAGQRATQGLGESSRGH